MKTNNQASQKHQKYITGYTVQVTLQTISSL